MHIYTNDIFSEERHLDFLFRFLVRDLRLLMVLKLQTESSFALSYMLTVDFRVKKEAMVGSMTFCSLSRL